MNHTLSNDEQLFLVTCHAAAHQHSHAVHGSLESSTRPGLLLFNVGAVRECMEINPRFISIVDFISVSLKQVVLPLPANIGAGLSSVAPL